MQVQNYKNHARMIPAYHYMFFLIVIVCLAGSIWIMFRAYGHHSGRLTAAVLLGLCIALLIIGWYARVFALAAQDRAIRAEESLRHFALTGKLPDQRLTLPQLIALRFAEDTEFLLLAERAVNDNMKASDIKKAIVNWRADNHRV